MAVEELFLYGIIKVKGDPQQYINDRLKSIEKELEWGGRESLFKGAGYNLIAPESTRYLKKQLEELKNGIIKNDAAWGEIYAFLITNKDGEKGLISKLYSLHKGEEVSLGNIVKFFIDLGYEEVGCEKKNGEIVKVKRTEENITFL